MMAAILAQTVDETFSNEAMARIRSAWASQGEVIIIIAAMVFLLGGIFLCVLLFGAKRSDRRRHRHRRFRKRSERPPEVAAGNGSSTPQPAPTPVLESQSQRRHRHRHRKEHFPRNPTLAETGGLPPVRDTKPPPAPGV